MVFLLLISLAAFFPGQTRISFAILSVIVFVLIVLSLMAGIRPPELLRGSRPLFFIVLGVFFFQGIEFSPPGFSLAGFGESVIFCVRIGAAFAAGSLVFSVTTPGEIRKSLTRLEAFFRLEKLRLGLHISLLLGFLPGFFAIWEDVNLAWKSRGGKKNLSYLVVLVPLALERMMVKAAETASAMESRGGG